MRVLNTRQPRPINRKHKPLVKENRPDRHYLRVVTVNEFHATPTPLRRKHSIRFEPHIAPIRNRTTIRRGVQPPRPTHPAIQTMVRNLAGFPITPGRAEHHAQATITQQNAPLHPRGEKTTSPGHAVTAINRSAFVTETQVGKGPFLVPDRP